jgi:hypothetical protein
MSDTVALAIKNILSNIDLLEDKELRAINTAVIKQLKSNRNQLAAVNRAAFEAGDRVKWSGRRGEQVGTIVRVKRKKAIVSVNEGRRPGNWDVPLGMLSAA